MKPSLLTRVTGGLSAVAAFTLTTLPAIAQEAAAEAAPAAEVAKLDSGDTAWMLVSTVIVLLMSIPGLALFYGGMVRKKNVLNTTAMVFVAVALLSVRSNRCRRRSVPVVGTPYPLPL